jgi:hypothetical protein
LCRLPASGEDDILSHESKAVRVLGIQGGHKLLHLPDRGMTALSLTWELPWPQQTPQPATVK